MKGKREFWPASHATGPFSVAAEHRAALAWELLGKFALVAGTNEGEDSAGRAKVGYLSVEETVGRAFALADAYVDMATVRGELREQTEADIDAAFVRSGQLEALRTEAQYPHRAKLADKVAA